jgi:hypothetical protein
MWTSGSDGVARMRTDGSRRVDRSRYGSHARIAAGGFFLPAPGSMAHQALASLVLHQERSIQRTLELTVDLRFANAVLSFDSPAA